MHSIDPYPVRSTIIDGTSNTFKGVKDCDTEFVGVALQSTSTLVTVDQRLKSEIKKDTTVSHCKCVTVEEEYYKHIITIP